MYSQPSNQNYSVATGSSTTNPFVEVFFSRDPTPNDVEYPIQKRWFNTSNETEWILISFTSFNGNLQAVWIRIGSGSGGGNLEWVSVITSTQQMAVDTGYSSNFDGLITYNLPLSARLGDLIKVVEVSSGTKTQINVNSGQQIQMGPKFCTASTGNVSGTYSPMVTNQGNCITLVCMIPNILFIATDWTGNWKVT